MKGKRKLSEAFSNVNDQSNRKVKTSKEDNKDPFEELNKDSFILSSKAIFKTLEKSKKLKLCKVTNFDSVYLNEELDKYKSTKPKSKHFLITPRSNSS